MERAGDAAEKQMAFYLRRRYADNAEVRVINDLRVERQGEIAQLDHLVLHKHGMIIIESKSVTGEVHINSQLEFVRIFGRSRSGMPSPIQQAGRQGDLLRELLTDHREALRQKALLGLLQGGFRHCPIDVLVAISDQGIINRPKKDIPELHKADQVVDEVDRIIKRHRSGASLVLRQDGKWGLYKFEPGELERICEFLVARHIEPATDKLMKTEPARATHSGTGSKTDTRRDDRADTRNSIRSDARTDRAPATMPSYLCTHCHSTNIEVRFARSYYFKCSDCEGNTAIKNLCRKCGGPTKTKRRGPEFAAVCQSCGREDLFFRNRA